MLPMRPEFESVLQSHLASHWQANAGGILLPVKSGNGRDSAEM